MTIIQVIGLPGSGKSEAVHEVINNPDVRLVQKIDIADFKGINREARYIQAIRDTPHTILAESACGVTIPGTTIVQLIVPLALVYERTLQRDGVLDEDYYSLLQTQMVPPDYIVYNDSVLSEFLLSLL
jgi:dephospho-CoA kinase